MLSDGSALSICFICFSFSLQKMEYIYDLQIKCKTIQSNSNIFLTTEATSVIWIMR